MKKALSILLAVLMLVFSLTLSIRAEGEPPDSPGAFAGFADGGTPPNYVITSDVLIDSVEERVYLTAGQVTINSGVTVTVGVLGGIELNGATLVNNGTIVTIHDGVTQPPESGWLKLVGSTTLLTNNGTVTASGNIEANSGATLANAAGRSLTVSGTGRLEVITGAHLTNAAGGSITIEGQMRLGGSAILDNSGAITGVNQGRFTLSNPPEDNPGLSITGLSFYESAASAEPIVDPNSTFVYDSVSEKWVVESQGGDGPPPPESDGLPRYVTVKPSANGQIFKVVPPDGEAPVVTLIDEEETITITHLDSLEFKIVPNAGFRVKEVRATIGDFINDYSWALSYNGDGSYRFLFEQINDTQTIEVIYDSIDAGDLTELLYQTYAVLNDQAGSEANIKDSLANQLGQWGTPILPEDIAITNGSVNRADINMSRYGTFSYTLTHHGISMPLKDGFILLSDDLVAFRVTGTKNNMAVDTLNVANPVELASNEIEVPAVDAGFLDIFGYGNIMALPMSDSLANSMVNGKTPLPFYSAQYHIIGQQNLNLYGFYVIQEDAYSIHVDAKPGLQLQKAMTWSLNRYANLTNGAGTSDVFFGNDEFVVQPPTNGIGGVSSFEVTTGEFTGYTVSMIDNNKYLVQFLSDFYDHVSLSTLINGTEQRTLNIHRVGVNIEAYQADPSEEQGIVGHGTQFGTAFDYSVNRYQLYATYYIPDFVDLAPYGLYVTYTWRNGTTTTRIITAPCDNPPPSRQDSYENGVYLYDGNDVSATDYLLYAAPDDSNAPIRVNVTVMKDDPTAADTFGGIFLGSGRGVEWTPNN